MRFLDMKRARPASVAGTIRIVAGVAFLLFQVAMMVRARFDPDRYFCWAPHDSQNEYEIVSVVDGRALDRGEVHARYHLPAVGVDPRAIEHIKDVIRARESQATQAAQVTVLYRTNGASPERWSWPER